jgi:YHS domain-containing protein/copper chaperone CopZ
LSKLKGISSVGVDHSDSTFVVKFDAHHINPRIIMDTLKEKGYDPVIKDAGEEVGSIETLDEEGVGIDPVCGMTVDKATGIKREIDGEMYYFCREECAVTFERSQTSSLRSTRSVA